jgi:hypothetical protein
VEVKLEKARDVPSKQDTAYNIQNTREEEVNTHEICQLTNEVKFIGIYFTLCHKY